MELMKIEYHFLAACVIYQPLEDGTLLFLQIKHATPSFFHTFGDFRASNSKERAFIRL